MPRPRSPVSCRYHSVALRGELGARAGRSVVDLVVDVGDVVDELRVVAVRAQPRAQPHADDERPRVADVGARVDRRAAEVHADRAGRRRQLDERARGRVVEPHAVRVVRAAAPRRAAARAAPPRAPALARRRSARRAAPAGCRRPPSARAAAPSPRPSSSTSGIGARSSTKRASVSGLCAKLALGGVEHGLRRAPAASTRSCAPRTSGTASTGTRAGRRAPSSGSAASTSTESERMRSRSRCTSWRGRPSSSR